MQGLRRAHPEAAVMLGCFLNVCVGQGRLARSLWPGLGVPRCPRVSKPAPKRPNGSPSGARGRELACSRAHNLLVGFARWLLRPAVVVLASLLCPAVFVFFRLLRSGRFSRPAVWHRVAFSPEGSVPQTVDQTGPGHQTPKLPAGRPTRRSLLFEDPLVDFLRV